MKNVLSRIISFILFLFFSIIANSQTNEINFQNASFESFRFSNEEDLIIHNWYNIELQKMFPIKTSQILHLPENEKYEVSTKAHHGNNFISLEVGENNTWGSIGQTLDEYLDTSSCYNFSLYLAKSDDYKNTRLLKKNPKEQDFLTPITLRIWGVDDEGVSELLAISPPVKNNNWEKYEFSFHPKREHIYFILEAFPFGGNYDFPNGHILIDNISVISYSKCNEKGTSILKEDAIKKEKDLKENAKNVINIRKAGTGFEFSKNKIAKESKNKIQILFFWFSKLQNKKLVFDFNGLRSKNFNKRREYLEEVLIEKGFEKHQFEIRNSIKEDDNILWIAKNDNLFIGLINE